MISTLKDCAAILRSDKRGVTAMEYGLIAAAVSVVIITAMTTLGPALAGAFGRITTALSGAGTV